MTEIFDTLLAACDGRSDVGAVRVRARYEPTAGAGAKVFPPTYAIDGKYIKETRYVDGVAHPAVVLDAPQSQANRIELALLDAIDADGLPLPFIEVSADIDGVAFRVTSLDAPHRSPDAYFRDAQMPDGTAFDDSAIGASLIGADAASARPLFRYSPTDLLLGIWNSQRRQRGARLPRAYTSEVVGYDYEAGKRLGGRLDQYNLQSAGIVYDENDKSVWAVTADGLPAGVKGKKGKASNVLHGQIPGEGPGGFAVSGVDRVAVVSVGVLSRLRFPDEGGVRDRGVDAAGRAVLAALGLLGDRLAFGGPSVFLRSGCDLLLVDEAVEWVKRGGQTESIELDAATARTLFDDAVRHAAALGLTFNDEPVVLEPKPNLRELLALNFAAPATDDD